MLSSLKSFPLLLLSLGVGVFIGAMLHAPEIKAAASVETFSYRIRYISMYSDPEEEMDSLGKNGWDLVSVGPVEQITEYNDNRGNGAHQVTKRFMVFKKSSASR